MKFRQIHLDFHTSECIDNIGGDFSKEQFQSMLKRGHVDSITVFSKCHHGWAYHPSVKNEQHPHLSFDLLGAQIEAAHEIGVRTPVYISAGFDEKAAVRHPEWIRVASLQESIQPLPQPPFADPGYHVLCMNTPYLDYLCDQIEEVVQRYDADGIFLDIVGVRTCYCRNCMRTMLNEGMDPTNPAHALALAERVYANYTRRVRESVDKYKPGLPVFHNGGHIRRGRRDIAHMNSHLELESLPTGGWGYDHFPLSASYARTLGMDYLGMTGKFHTSWGEFGGYKHPNALRYEVALSAAFGAKCSIGDQMHPYGFLDPATYEIIGAAYSELEEKEPWLDHVNSIADIGILSQEAVNNYYLDAAADTRNSSGDIGAARIMLEGKYLFDIIDTEEPLEKYKLLILPDTIRLDDALTKKLTAFVQQGGKILATGESGLDQHDNRFVLRLGADYLFTNEFNPVYFRPRFEMEGQPDAAYVIYAQAHSIQANGTVLVDRENPFFNRTGEHFCSHKHAPNDPAIRYPAATMGQDGAYVSAHLFEEYTVTGSLIAKRILTHIIDLLLDQKKTVTTDLPIQGIVTLMEQKTENRMICHMLYATPVKRGNGIEVIEELLPVRDTHVSLRLPQTPKKVELVPKSEPIPYSFQDGVLSFTVSEFTNHAMIAISF